MLFSFDTMIIFNIAGIRAISDEIETHPTLLISIA